MKKTAVILLVFAPLFVLFAAPAAFGAEEEGVQFVPIVEIGEIPMGPDVSLGKYLNSIFDFTIKVGAFLAVIMLVLGGFEYMTSREIEGKSKGRERIQGAVVGLILLLSSYLILYVINPNILKLDILDTASEPTSSLRRGGGSGGEIPPGQSGDSVLQPRMLVPCSEAAECPGARRGGAASGGFYAGFDTVNLPPQFIRDGTIYELQYAVSDNLRASRCMNISRIQSCGFYRIQTEPASP